MMEITTEEMKKIEEIEERFSLPELTNTEGEKRLDIRRRSRYNLVKIWEDGGELEAAFKEVYNDWTWNVDNRFIQYTVIPKMARQAAVVIGTMVRAEYAGESDKEQGAREFYTRTRDLLLSCLPTDAEKWRHTTLYTGRGFNDYGTVSEIELHTEWIRMPYAVFKKYFGESFKNEYDAETKTVSVELNDLEKAAYEVMTGVRKLHEKEEKTEDTAKTEKVEKKPVRVSYMDYKVGAYGCFETVADSYDDKTYTVEILLPEDMEYKPGYVNVEMTAAQYKAEFPKCKLIGSGYFFSLEEMVTVVVPVSREVIVKDYKRVRMHVSEYKEKYGQYPSENIDHTTGMCDVWMPEDTECDTTQYRWVDMPYKTYKEKFAQYSKGEYNPRKRSIKVWLPEGVDYKKTKRDKNREKVAEFKGGYVDEVTITPDMIDPDGVSTEIPAELRN